MLKKIFFVIAFQGGAMLFAQQGVLKIEVKDSISGEVLESAAVIVESAGITAGQGLTDEKGNLVLKNLGPGEYNVKIMYSGYPKNVITGVLITNNETTYLDVALSSDNVIDGFVFVEYEIPLIPPGTSIKRTLGAEEIGRSALDPLSLISNIGGGVEVGGSGGGMRPSYRGARTTSNVYVIDGQTAIGSLGLPRMAIQQMSITLGGVPAMYGDGTGAFIEIETRSGLVNSNR